MISGEVPSLTEGQVVWKAGPEGIAPGPGVAVVEVVAAAAACRVEER